MAADVKRPKSKRLKSALAAGRKAFNQVAVRRTAEQVAGSSTGTALERYDNAEVAESKALAAFNSPRNMIAAMVAEQTGELRGRIMQLESDKAILSDRIDYLENPNKPRHGMVGSGTGVFPRRRSDRSDIAGRPGKLKDLVEEGVAGEMARRTEPSVLEARRELTDTEKLGGYNRYFRPDENLQPCCEGPLPPVDRAPNR